MHQLVDRFDESGIVLKTHNQQQDQNQVVKKEKESSVSKMAKSALRRK